MDDRQRSSNKNASIVLASSAVISPRFSCSVIHTKVSNIPRSMMIISVSVSTFDSNSANIEAAHHVLKKRCPFIGIGQTAARSVRTWTLNPYRDKKCRIASLDVLLPDLG